MQPFTTSRAGIATIAALALGLLLSSMPATAALAADDDTVGIAGAPADDSGADGRSRFTYAADPGQHIEDFYEVRNTGTVEQELTVFATDAFNNDDGGFALLDTEATPTDAGSWITVGGKKQVTVTLPAGGSKVLPVDLTVPADASPGDHAAGIVVSTVSPDGQVLVDRRVGSRLYVRVAGDLQPLLTITGMSPSYSPTINPFDGTTTVTYTVENAGNVALSASAVTGVRTFFGLETGQLVRTEVEEMLPGSTRALTVTVPGVGQWGYLNPYVRMIGKADGFIEAPIQETRRDVVMIVVPWTILAVIVLGVAIWLFVRWRRRRDEKNAAAWVAHTEAEARRKAEAESVPVPVGAPADDRTDR
ncbi:DUF916 domain-containing protein [Microbacterium terricola]|uniref:DUF916 domain-containing protein n=1 Tax=Microbacterium terricola TaxID=344163 RepID=A0ABM8E357_9MICO|nr:DUF916 domain-containing protein [Microbacterium terricola]UYK40078.1 DUF916 domain-containing protein [Microbacterium terricola]BDV32225.1 hypothetical protein Microterr_28850 [Microbacterium terricola]